MHKEISGRNNILELAPILKYTVITSEDEVTSDDSDSNWYDEDSDNKENKCHIKWSRKKVISGVPRTKIHGAVLPELIAKHIVVKRKRRYANRKLKQKELGKRREALRKFFSTYLMI